MRDDAEVWRAFVKRSLYERVQIWRNHARARFANARQPDRPIFLVGCPRSGTTLFFRLLSLHESLRSLPFEGHQLWSAYQHPRRKGWSSDAATADDVQRGEKQYLYAAIGSISRGKRFLDKTPRNVMKIPYLAELFPNAYFLFVKRDGRATVASLIEGWRKRRGISYRLPQRLELDGYKGRLWSYILPVGWRDLLYTTIPKVAARQYVVSNEYAMNGRRFVDPERFIEVAFETLLENPVGCVREMLARLRLPPSDALMGFTRDIHNRPVGTISAPRPDKWKESRREIDLVLDDIDDVMTRLGYDSSF